MTASCMTTWRVRIKAGDAAAPKQPRRQTRTRYTRTAGNIAQYTTIVSWRRPCCAGLGRALVIMFTIDGGVTYY